MDSFGGCEYFLSKLASILICFPKLHHASEPSFSCVAVDFFSLDWNEAELVKKMCNGKVVRNVCGNERRQFKILLGISGDSTQSFPSDTLMPVVFCDPDTDLGFILEQRALK